MPVIHYWVATPPAFRYISTASNFFAFDSGVQALTLGVALSLSAGVTIAREVIIQNGFYPLAD